MLQAETDGRKVVEAMYDVLPPELCDWVYSYLIPQNTIQDVSDVFCNDFPEYIRFPNSPPFGGPCMIDGDLLVPPPPPPPPSSFPWPRRENVHPPDYVHPGGRIFRPEFISQDVAIEAAKLYYQGNTFKAVVHCHPRSLNRLLTVDRFNLGLEPFALIQKLYLELPAECCRSRRCNRVRRDRVVDANADEPRRLAQYRTEIATNLALIPLENRPKMEFTVVITLRNPSSTEEVFTTERYLLNMLFVIEGIVYDLKQHGSKVHVYALIRAGQRVDITALFPLSPEQWQNVRSHPSRASLVC
jgi:hypothetical protein